MDTQNNQELPMPHQTEIVEIDQRLRNVEQIVDVVKHVSDKAVDSWAKYLEQKTQQAEKESTLADFQHKRSTGVLVYVVSLVFMLCVIALFKEQYELVKLIIGSSLAVGAGAGLHTLFKGKQSEKP